MWKGLQNISILTLTTCMYSTITIFVRLSNTVSAETNIHTKYNFTSTLLLSEILKLLITLIVILYQIGLHGMLRICQKVR